MDAWKNEMLDIMMLILGNPQTLVQGIITGVAGIVSFLAAICIISGITGVGRPSLFPAILTLACGTVIVAASVAAVRLYALAHITPNAHFWAQAAGAAAGFLLVYLPLQCLIQKTNYVKALIISVLSIVAAGAVIALVNVIYGAIASGEGQFRNIRGRKGKMDAI